MVGQSIRQPLPSSYAGWPWRFWGKWIGANALAELVGLGTSSLLWALFFLGMEERLGTLLAASIVVIGSTILEGSAVGVAQWRVLRHPLPKLPLRAWWAATAVGAFIAWTLAMVPSTLMALGEQATQSAPPEMSDTLVYSLAAGMGLALGVLLALPQWWVLRRYLLHAWQWIPANAVAWALGMPITFVVIGSVAGETMSLWAILLLLAGLALAGAVVGAVHGTILVRILPRSSRAEVAS